MQSRAMVQCLKSVLHVTLYRGNLLQMICVQRSCCKRFVFSPLVSYTAKEEHLHIALWLGADGFNHVLQGFPQRVCIVTIIRK